MTHDELLTKINKPYFFTEMLTESKVEIDKKIAALRAVVELHKSKKTTYQKMLGKWASDSPVLSCEYCGGYYPCSTILLIEKELS